MNMQDILKDSSIENYSINSLVSGKDGIGSNLPKSFMIQWNSFNIEKERNITLLRLIKYTIFEDFKDIPSKYRGKKGTILIGDAEYFSRSEGYEYLYKLFKDENDSIESDKFLIKFIKSEDMLMFKSLETGTIIFLVFVK